MACAGTDGGMSDHPKWVLQPQKSALRFFVGKYLSIWVVFCRPQAAQGRGYAMDDREELRRLIDVIEKSSASGSLEQAVDDIKTLPTPQAF